MGITRAIGNAVSGLSASARAAEIVSRNLANARVEGYTAKRLELSHAVHGGQGAGVRVDATLRAVDAAATLARRQGEGRAELAGGEADALRRLADLVLDAGGPDSLQARVQKLDAALVALADTPESAVNREEAVAAASGVARKLNMLSGEVVRLRADLDAEIARQVAQVNEAVQRIERLNREIEVAKATGQDATGLEDERQRQVDVVNRIVPIRSSPDRGPGRLLTAAGGGMLADTSSVPLAFATTAGADGTSAMGGLRLGPVDATPAGPPPASPLLSGGSLEALFRARDVFAPDMARQLDETAAGLIRRFQDFPGYDDPAGSTGLFVAGADGFLGDADPIDALARRIAVNPDLDPAVGGDPAGLVSGLFGGRATAAAGAAPYPSLLREAMLARPAAGATPARPSATAAIAALGASAEAAAARAEAEAGFAQGAATALRDAEIARQGVDTDAELRDLLTIERAYAANARVLQVVDDMMRRLLEI